MKNLILFLFMLFYSISNFSQKYEINKSKPFSLEIKATENENNPNSCIISIIIINNKKYPKIIKLGCIATYKIMQYSIALMITNNDKRFYDLIMNKCGISKYFLFFKKSIGGYKIDFNHLHTNEFKSPFLNNNIYGIYSLQASYYLPKDTLYSNIIKVEYTKDGLIILKNE